MMIDWVRVLPVAVTLSLIGQCSAVGTTIPPVVWFAGREDAANSNHPLENTTTPVSAKTSFLGRLNFYQVNSGFEPITTVYNESVNSTTKESILSRPLNGQRVNDELSAKEKNYFSVETTTASTTTTKRTKAWTSFFVRTVKNSENSTANSSKASNIISAETLENMTASTINPKTESSSRRIVSTRSPSTPKGQEYQQLRTKLLKQRNTTTTTTTATTSSELTTSTPASKLLSAESISKQTVTKSPRKSNSTTARPQLKPNKINNTTNTQKKDEEDNIENYDDDDEDEEEDDDDYMDDHFFDDFYDKSYMMFPDDISSDKNSTNIKRFTNLTQMNPVKPFHYKKETREHMIIMESTSETKLPNGTVRQISHTINTRREGNFDPEGLVEIIPKEPENNTHVNQLPSNHSAASNLTDSAFAHPSSSRVSSLIESPPWKTHKRRSHRIKTKGRAENEQEKPKRQSRKKKKHRKHHRKSTEAPRRRNRIKTYTPPPDEDVYYDGDDSDQDASRYTPSDDIYGIDDYDFDDDEDDDHHHHYYMPRHHYRGSSRDNEEQDEDADDDEEDNDENDDDKEQNDATTENPKSTLSSTAATKAEINTTPISQQVSTISSNLVSNQNKASNVNQLQTVNTVSAQSWRPNKTTNRLQYTNSSQLRIVTTKKPISAIASSSFISSTQTSTAAVHAMSPAIPVISYTVLPPTTTNRVKYLEHPVSYLLLELKKAASQNPTPLPLSSTNPAINLIPSSTLSPVKPQVSFKNTYASATPTPKPSVSSFGSLGTVSPLPGRSSLNTVSPNLQPQVLQYNGNAANQSYSNYDQQSYLPYGTNTATAQQSPYNSNSGTAQQQQYNTNSGTTQQQQYNPNIGTAQQQQYNSNGGTLQQQQYNPNNGNAQQTGQPFYSTDNGAQQIQTTNYPKEQQSNKYSKDDDDDEEDEEDDDEEEDEDDPEEDEDDEDNDDLEDEDEDEENDRDNYEDKDDDRASEDSFQEEEYKQPKRPQEAKYRPKPHKHRHHHHIDDNDDNNRDTDKNAKPSHQKHRNHNEKLQEKPSKQKHQESKEPNTKESSSSKSTNRNREYKDPPPRKHKSSSGKRIHYQDHKPSSSSHGPFEDRDMYRPKEIPAAANNFSIGAPAKACDRSYCRLPKCFCSTNKKMPGNMNPADVPQMVMLTFDDSVNDINFLFYDQLFGKHRTNPNGCPILGTFYVSHEWTDYGKVQSLYSKGHEIASHSISHRDGANFSPKTWADEIHGQKEIISLLASVNPSDIKGMRAPFLQSGGNKMYSMLHANNFTYDSSLPVHDNSPPYWPYTLEYAFNHECNIPPCPTNSYQGLWEVPLVMWTDLKGGRCSMADACHHPRDANGVYENLKKNFQRHYNGNRAPFGMYFHYAWFTKPHQLEGFTRFLDDILKLRDVYLVTTSQMIEWMRHPTPVNRLTNFYPWQCRRNNRPPPCHKSRVCNYKFQGAEKSVRTCQQCPPSYPWVGNPRGLKQKRVKDTKKEKHTKEKGTH